MNQNDPKNRYAGFQERCARFGGRILVLMGNLPVGRIRTTIADQLARSATAIGANACEARSAESRADFVHKMQVALKEAREAYHWLSVARECNAGNIEAIMELQNECDELIAVMVASVRTAKRNAIRES